MAKIIKVGSQNPTITPSKDKKAGSIQTHRNSNEATNPFKFTNFEGKTLPFEYADVFQSFKPQSASKLRIIASSVAGSMNKMRSSITEPIINFVHRVSDWTLARKDQLLATPFMKKTNEILFTPIELPKFEGINLNLDGLKERYNSSVLNRDIVDIGKGLVVKCNSLVPNISFHGKQKYSNMSVEELRICLADALAEGGIND